MEGSCEADDNGKFLAAPCIHHYMFGTVKVCQILQRTGLEIFRTTCIQSALVLFRLNCMIYFLKSCCHGFMGLLDIYIYTYISYNIYIYN